MDKNFVRQADRVGDRLGAWGKKHERALALLIAGAAVGWLTGALLPAWVGFVLGGAGLAIVAFVVWAVNHKGESNGEGTTTSGPQA